MVYSLNNICTKNYWNKTTTVKIIYCWWLGGILFLKHSVECQSLTLKNKSWSTDSINKSCEWSNWRLGYQYLSKHIQAPLSMTVVKVKQESLVNAKVNARQHCVNEMPITDYVLEYNNFSLEDEDSENIASKRYCSGCTDPERWWAGRRVFFLRAKLPF